MSKPLRFFAAAVLLLCFHLGTVLGADDTLTIALDKSIPGKFGVDTCEIFGQTLYQRLVAAGGEAHYLVYNWKNMEGEWECHAIVVCRDAKGQYLGMDQTRRMPVLLIGKTPEEWVKWFHGPGEVELVSSTTPKSLAGNYADLSRKPGKKSVASKVIVSKKTSQESMNRPGRR